MLRLRPYKKCDAKVIASWIKDEVSFRKWSADRYEKYPVRDVDINNHYEAAAFSDSFFPMTAFDENRRCRTSDHEIYRSEKRVLSVFGFIIVDDSKRGMGYGKEMLKLSLQYAF